MADETLQDAETVPGARADADGALAGESADELFAKLERLMSELPEMQRADEALARARAAESVLAAQREMRACTFMLDRADEALAQERAGLREATAAGDAAAEEVRERGILYFSQQRGYRVGPAENARRAYESTLTASPFATAEEAASAALPRSEQERIEARLAEYRAEYAHTLAACEAIGD